MPANKGYCIAILLSIFALFRGEAVEMSEQQYELVRDNLIDLYQGAVPKSLPNIVAQRQGELLILTTADDTAGVIWLRTPLKLDKLVVLQIPHQFHDLYTLDIAKQWFEKGHADVLMFNTQHRYETDNSDLARLKLSLFTASIAAYKALDISVSVVQLHGYNAAKRETQSAQQADIILSNGTDVPNSDLVSRQSCLRDNGGLLARVYGRDVFELGATVNPVGKLINLKRDGIQRFLHIEMPLAIREAFLNQQIDDGAITCLIGR